MGFGFVSSPSYERRRREMSRWAKSRRLADIPCHVSNRVGVRPRVGRVLEPLIKSPVPVDTLAFNPGETKKEREQDRWQIDHKDQQSRVLKSRSVGNKAFQ